MTIADQVRAFVTRYSIGRSRALFEKRRNPFHAWAAYRWARHNNEPIPDWVLEYFDRCAERLERTKRKDILARLERTKPKDILDAFEMASSGGGPSILRRADGESDRLKVAQMFQALKEKHPGTSDEQIRGMVVDQLDPSQEHVRKPSEEHIRRAYYAFRGKL